MRNLDQRKKEKEVNGPSELSGAGTTAMDVARCVGTHSDTKTSGSCSTGSRKRHQSFVLRRRLIVVAVLSCVLFAPSRSHSERTRNQDDDRVALELSALGKQGDTIARARGQVLDILQYGNACTVWFQEADPDPAEVFRSLHFELEMKGPSYVYGMRDQKGLLFKHPWAAKSIQYGGSNSIILLNANGPFFNRTSIVMQLNPGGMLLWPEGTRLLTVSSYNGNTPEAQITILLHELGHIIGRLPEDADSWDGQSSRNTSEVVRRCRAETHAAAHNSPKGSI